MKHQNFKLTLRILKSFFVLLTIFSTAFADSNVVGMVTALEPEKNLIKIDNLWLKMSPDAIIKNEKKDNVKISIQLHDIEPGSPVSYKTDKKNNIIELMIMQKNIDSIPIYPFNRSLKR